MRMDRKAVDMGIKESTAAKRQLSEVIFQEDILSVILAEVDPLFLVLCFRQANCVPVPAAPSRPQIDLSCQSQLCRRLPQLRFRSA